MLACPDVGRVPGALSGKDRHELKRKMRNSSASCPPSPLRPCGRRGMDEALGRFLTLPLFQGRKARFMDARMERFFPTSLALARKGWGGCGFSIRGVPVASFLCASMAAASAVQFGLRSAYPRLAPGIVLLAHMIRDAIERGVPVFDFLRGEESYKRDFGPTPEPLLNIRILP